MSVQLSSCVLKLRADFWLMNARLHCAATSATPHASSEWNEWSRSERRPMPDDGDGFFGIFAFGTSLARWIIEARHKNAARSAESRAPSPRRVNIWASRGWLVDNEKQSSALSRSENSGILLQTHHSTLMWTVLGVSRRLCPWRKTSLFVSRFVNKFSWKIYSACIQNGRERIIERTRVNGFAQNEAARVTIKRSCCWKLSFRRNRQQRFHFAKCHERARPKHAKPRDARQKFIKLLPRQSKASKGGKNYSCAFLICDSRKNKHKRLVSWKIMAGYVDVGCELTLDDAFRGCKHSKRAAKPVHIDAHSEKPFRVQECER